VRLSHMLYFDDFLTVRCLALDHSRENLNDDLARDDRRQSVCEPAGPAQIVLVLQGGGALGAHQGGAYEALQRSGRNRRIYHYDQTQPHEPGDWCDLAEYGCRTRMHVVRLLAPRLDNENHTKDIDVSSAGIRCRWEAGYAHTMRALERRAWEDDCDPLEGVILHETERS
jgi:Patatin phospholipase